MNPNDLTEVKYYLVKVFVDYTKGDERLEIPKRGTDELEQLVKIAHITESNINGFRSYLKTKLRRFNDDEAELGEWLDTLTFEDIDDTDLKIYILPINKIKVNQGDEFYLITGLYEAAQQFITDLKGIKQADDVIGRYRFFQGGITVEYFYRKGMPSTNAKKQASTAHKAFIAKAKECVTKFNENNDIYKIEWTKSISPVFEFEEEFNGKEYVGMSLNIAASVDLSRKDKNEVDQAYSHYLFNMINDEKCHPQSFEQYLN